MVWWSWYCICPFSEVHGVLRTMVQPYGAGTNCLQFKWRSSIQSTPSGVQHTLIKSHGFSLESPRTKQSLQSIQYLFQQSSLAMSCDIQQIWISSSSTHWRFRCTAAPPFFHLCYCGPDPYNIRGTEYGVWSNYRISVPFSGVNWAVHPHTEWDYLAFGCFLEAAISKEIGTEPRSPRLRM